MTTHFTMSSYNPAFITDENNEPTYKKSDHRAKCVTPQFTSQTTNVTTKYTVLWCAHQWCFGHTNGHGHLSVHLALVEALTLSLSGSRKPYVSSSSASVRPLCLSSLFFSMNCKRETPEQTTDITTLATTMMLLFMPSLVYNY